MRVRTRAAGRCTRRSGGRATAPVRRSARSSGGTQRTRRAQAIACRPTRRPGRRRRSRRGSSNVEDVHAIDRTRGCVTPSCRLGTEVCRAPRLLQSTGHSSGAAYPNVGGAASISRSSGCDLREIRRLLDGKKPPARACARDDEKRRRDVRRELVVEPLELDHGLAVDALLGDEPRELDRIGERLDGDQRRVRVEDGNRILVELRGKLQRLEELRPTVDSGRRAAGVTAPSATTSTVSGVPARTCMPTIAGSTRAARLSTFETMTDWTPEPHELIENARRLGVPRTGRRGPGRRAKAFPSASRNRLPSGRRRGAAVWTKRSGSPRRRSTRCAAIASSVAKLVISASGIVPRARRPAVSSPRA